MELAGASAIVTGAASGLGAATARLLAGSDVAVIGLDLPAALARAPHVDGVTLVAGDVTDEASVAEAIARVEPSRPLRLAVNCAGVGPAARILSRKGPHDLEAFRKVVDINLTGTFNVLRLAAERMAAGPPLDDGQRGLIVNTASIAAYEGQIGQVAYSASKAGVVGMTIVAARELARDGIRVCTIAPGIVDTPMLAALGDEVRDSLAASIPFPQRLATPAEYARLVLMIAEHDYLNGETIRMDGAIRMPPQ